MTPAERDWFEAALNGDLQAVNDALVEMQRDPMRWFCSGIGRTTGRRRGDAVPRSGTSLTTRLFPNLDPISQPFAPVG